MADQNISLSLIAGKKDISLSRATDRYLNYKSKTLAENSMRAYRASVNWLNKHCPTFRHLNRNHINNILNSSDDSIRTKELRRSVIDTFIEWCVKEGILDTGFDTEIYKTRFESNDDQIVAISERQFKILLSGVDRAVIRDVMCVGFYMGLRISELLHCRPAWIVKDGTMLRVGDLLSWQLDDSFHPKSQNEYDVPIAIPSKVERIFTRYRKKPPYETMFDVGSESTLRRKLKSHFKGLPYPLCNTFKVHHLRHSCISYWMNERNVSVQEVKRLARHARIQTTMRYHHPDDDTHLNSFCDR